MSRTLADSISHHRGTLEFGIKETTVHKIGEYCSSNFGTCKLAPGVRTLNCAGPGAASKLLPEAPE
eukprot:13189445-Alexandrium_andersonii.AAC.1